MAILKHIIPCICCLILTGCYEAFTPDIEYEPVLCMNSMITAGQPIEVSVTHTRLYTDETADTEVPDASIAIYANGTLQEAGYIAREGDHIRLVAESSTYGRAEAEVIVPVAVGPESVEWIPTINSVYAENTEDPGVHANISFNLTATINIADPAEKENFYRFSYLGFYHSGNDGDDLYEASGPDKIAFSTGNFKYSAEPIFSEHIGIFESVMGGDSFGFAFFTDRQFSGKTYPLHLLFSECWWMADTDEWNPEFLDCGFELTLHTISESYYNWSNYLWQRDWGPAGDLGDIGLGDALWGFSNVSTGAGVVAAQSYKTYTVNLKDFIEETLSLKNLNR